jgi:hypothetical protein
MRILALGDALLPRCLEIPSMSSPDSLTASRGAEPIANGSFSLSRGGAQIARAGDERPNPSLLAATSQPSHGHGKRGHGIKSSGGTELCVPKHEFTSASRQAVPNAYP